MVGAMKPSVHFHTSQVILFEGRSDGALVNLADRLAHERRQGWRGYRLDAPQAFTDSSGRIDVGTTERDHWRGLQPEQLGRFGIYRVWRVDRARLERRAQSLQREGVDADWRDPRPERF